MSRYVFTQLDVFSDLPLMGNPLAVIHDADHLTDAEMQRFAKWANLSESVFLSQPQSAEADYRVRIFTPGGELPFAGHPTLGSCAAWLAQGGRPKTPGIVIQECGIGLIRVKQNGSRLAFTAPALRRTGPLEPNLIHQIAEGLGLTYAQILGHQWVDNGPGWCAVMLDSAERVLAVRPDAAALRELKLGIIGPSTPGSEVDFEVRAFVGPLGIAEDPVTGSLNAGLASWLINAGLAPKHYVVSQGTVLGRAGRIYIDQIGDDIWVGGDVMSCITGQIVL
jgi:PhzF family phenazine biosynthesis protein